jgi:hypothetical protein
LSQGNREMAYKKLADKCRQQALVPFLEAADDIHGLIITLLVSKRVQSVLELGGVAHLQQIVPALANWKTGTVEKLYRIQTWFAFLHTGLCDPAQRTCWLTDDDEIVGDTKRLATATNMLLSLSRCLFAHEIWLGSADTVNSMDARIAGVAKDIAAIPDLVGGALADAWSATAGNGFECDLSNLVAMSQEIPEKAKNIIEWFLRDDKPLRRLFAAIDLSEKDPTLLAFNWLKLS